MPIPLVGRTDDGAFTSGTYLGFSNGNANVTGYPVNSAGTATHFRCRVQSFGINNFIRCRIHRQTAGIGNFVAVATVDIPNTATTEPQEVALSAPVVITAGDVYNVQFWGDQTSVVEGQSYSIRRDPSTGIGGVGVVFGTYPTLPDPLPAVTAAVDGQLFWQIWGDAVGAENLSVTATLEVKGSVGTPISNRSLNVAVLDPADYSVIAAPAAQTSAAGVIVVDELSGVVVDDEVLLAVEDPAETDPLARNRVYRVSVYDANA